MNDLPQEILEKIHRHAARRSLANSSRLQSVSKRLRNAVPLNRPNRVKNDRKFLYPETVDKVGEREVIELKQRLRFLTQLYKTLNKPKYKRVFQQEESARRRFATIKNVAMGLLRKNKKTYNTIRQRNIDMTFGVFTVGNPSVRMTYRDVRMINNFNFNVTGPSQEPTLFHVIIHSSQNAIPFQVVFSSHADRRVDHMLFYVKSGKWSFVFAGHVKADGTSNSTQFHLGPWMRRPKASFHIGTLYSDVGIRSQQDTIDLVRLIHLLQHMDGKHLRYLISGRHLRDDVDRVLSKYAPTAHETNSAIPNFDKNNVNTNWSNTNSNVNSR